MNHRLLLLADCGTGTGSSRGDPDGEDEFDCGESGGLGEGDDMTSEGPDDDTTMGAKATAPMKSCQSKSSMPWQNRMSRVRMRSWREEPSVVKMAFVRDCCPVGD